MTLAEMLVASAILLTVTAAVGTVAARAQATFRVQPEVADLQQRARVAATALGQDLMMAGAGLSSTALAGPLVLHLPPIAPYRRGQNDDGARARVFYRPDALSLLYVPATHAEADILQTIDTGRDLIVDPAPNCGAVVHERVCGFTVGMRVLLLDPSGAFDLATVTEVAGDRLRVEPGGALAASYNRNAVIAEVVAPTYFLKADPATGAFQLMRYDGYRTERPMVDNVVAFRVEYFGDPRPPLTLAPVAAGDPARPLTTYGPPAPAGAVDDARDTWAPGENCVFVAGPAPRLAALAVGPSPTRLDPALMRDGPWCPDAAHAVRFDADLLRIRRVRVVVRVQVAVAAMRGPAGRLFGLGGTSASADFFAPDQQMVLDVAPRNLGVTP